MISTEDFFQAFPALTPSPTEFDSHLKSLRASLVSSVPVWPANYDLKANPYPIYIPPWRLAELQQLQSALHTAVVAIIQNWWSTPRYQAIIPTSPKIERVLRALASRRPYTKIGSHRPDFLIPLKENGPLTICEINARFVFNCFIAGAAIQDYIPKSGVKNDFPGLKESTVDNIVSAFSELFDETKPLALLKSRESKHDINLVRQIYNLSRFVDPEDLRLVACAVSPSGYTVADNHGRIEQIALQLHIDELEDLEEQLLLEVGARCYNDLHTVVFVHDKRMLGLILSELDHLVSSAALTIEQAHALQSGIAETHLPGSQKFRNILADTYNRHMWLIKPCRAGKGEGIVFGKNLDPATWECIIEPKSDSTASIGSPVVSEMPFVIQRYMIQKRHNLIVKPTNPGGPPRHVNWFMVGTMMCLNEFFLGSTVWRASDADMTAISTGGEYMGGVTGDSITLVGPKTARQKQSVPSTKGTLQLPDAVRFQIDSLSSLSDHQHISTIADALKIHGIAVIHLNFEDSGSAYMLNLAYSLGIPIDHSNANDPLWDVKAKNGEEAKSTAHLARSQTEKSFPWHTDCSFDTSPPRYFALHVIYSDRFGGGHLKVMPVGRILENLSTSAVETLKQPVFQIQVPPEFQKSIPHVTGALVTTDGKIRYRREIIKPLGPEAERALKELDIALENAESKGWAKILGDDIMKDGTIVCLDNAKWMHARSEVRDPQRWLRRIRWGPESF